jgi:ribosomal-protein-alanine N-acetyltransferase
MSAQPILPSAKREADDPGTSFAPMQLSDVPEVAAIERTIYTAPWTEGNFVDSLNAGYCAWTLRSTDRLDRDRKMIGRHPIIGYFILMAAVDEAHLLNVSIAKPWQSRGHGLYLLRRASAVAIEYKASSIILEVRPSNLRALSVYRRFGFREHGLRRRYYPASSDDHQSREDAIVMRLPL